MSALPPQYRTAEPTSWYDQLPTLDQFNYDVPAWLAEVQRLQDAQNATPMYAAAGPMDAPPGAGGQWESAGLSPQSYNYGKSPAQIAAETLNMKEATWKQEGVKGPGFGLMLDSRMANRPDEMRLAYEAIGKDGEPALSSGLTAYLEDVYGLSPTSPYARPPGAEEGGLAPVNALGGTFYDPATNTLVQSDVNPQPGSGLLEVPNNFDPNDPNATRVAQAMQIIALFVASGNVGYQADPTHWAVLDQLLTPLGIDPATFVAGVLNYNNYQLGEDGSVTAATGVFSGYTPPPDAGPSDYTPPVKPPPGDNSGGPWDQPPGAKEIDLNTFDPLSMQPQSQGMLATQLAQQYGNVSTINPLYPDWMLLGRQRLQGRVAPPRPTQGKALVNF